MYQAKKITYTQNSKEDLFRCTILCLLFPPFISSIFAFYKFLHYKSRSFGILFFVFFVLFLTYNFFSVDNSLRYFAANDIEDSFSWLTKDPLTIIMAYGKEIGLESSLFFYIYILATYIIWLSCYTNCKETKTINKIDIMIVISSMILRNAMDLLYYTLSLSTLLFLVSRKEKINLKDYLYIIPLIFILHPGVLFFLLPSIGLYYILNSSTKRRNNIVYFLYLGGVYIASALITHISIPTTGIAIIDTLNASFNHYTNNENKWGIRTTELSGITFFIQYYVISFFYAIIFIITLYKRDRIKQKFILAIFQIAFIMLPNFWNFVTLSERLLVALSLTSCLCIVMLIQTKAINIRLKYIAWIYIFIFSFNLFRATRMELSGVFKNKSYNEIVLHSYYVPSILLFDYQSWGFSNKFIESNSLFKYFFNR